MAIPLVDAGHAGDAPAGADDEATPAPSLAEMYIPLQDASEHGSEHGVDEHIDPEVAEAIEVGEVLGVGDGIIPDDDNGPRAPSSTPDFRSGPAAPSLGISVASAGEL